MCHGNATSMGKGGFGGTLGAVRCRPVRATGKLDPHLDDKYSDSR